MANAFNMLRPNDLIWPYVVNVYMKGQAPFPFDLLYWNSDSTRMPAANHAFYLRNCYLENKLAKGEMELAGVRLDLKKVKVPIFNLAAREDHIAPARSVFVGSKAFGGPVEYVLAGSGHIAGVVNPVAKPKYQFWTGGPVEGDLEDWIARARRASRHLVAVLVLVDREAGPEARAAREARRRQARSRSCDAPGTYVTRPRKGRSTKPASALGQSRSQRKRPARRRPFLRHENAQYLRTIGAAGIATFGSSQR